MSRRELGILCDRGRVETFSRVVQGVGQILNFDPGIAKRWPDNSDREEVTEQLLSPFSYKIAYDSPKVRRQASYASERRDQGGPQARSQRCRNLPFRERVVAEFVCDQAIEE